MHVALKSVVVRPGTVPSNPSEPCQSTCPPQTCLRVRGSSLCCLSPPQTLPDLVERDFGAPGADQLWVADIGARCSPPSTRLSASNDKKWWMRARAPRRSERTGYLAHFGRVAWHSPGRGAGAVAASKVTIGGQNPAWRMVLDVVASPPPVCKGTSLDCDRAAKITDLQSSGSDSPGRTPTVCTRVSTCLTASRRLRRTTGLPRSSIPTRRDPQWAAIEGQVEHVQVHAVDALVGQGIWHSSDGIDGTVPGARNAQNGRLKCRWASLGVTWPPLHLVGWHDSDRFDGTSPGRESGQKPARKCR